MTDQTAAAWRLVEIAELVRRGEQLHLSAMSLLPAEVRAEMPKETDTTMPAVDIEQLASIAVESVEIAEQVRQLAQSLPDEDVAIVYEDVREAAAADLEQGVLDHERVLVAARVLEVRNGWPALAEALRVVDIRDSWTHATPCRTLSAFRGAGRQLVSRALQPGAHDRDPCRVDLGGCALASAAGENPAPDAARSPRPAGRAGPRVGDDDRRHAPALPPLRDLGVIERVDRSRGRATYRLRSTSATHEALWRLSAPLPVDINERFATRLSTIVLSHRTALERLRARREAIGLSQPQLARRIGIGEVTLGRIERGQIDPRLSQVLVLADELDFPLEQLFASGPADHADACP